MDKLSTTASLNNSVFEFMWANWCWLGVGISVNPPAAARHDPLMTEPIKDGENTTFYSLCCILPRPMAMARTYIVKP